MLHDALLTSFMTSFFANEHFGRCGTAAYARAAYFFIIFAWSSVVAGLGPCSIASSVSWSGQSDERLAREPNSSDSPFLIFTGALSSIPLDLLSQADAFAFAIAFPGSLAPSTSEETIRNLVRHGLHVALTKTDARRFASATGKPLLLVEKLENVGLSEAELYDSDTVRTIHANKPLLWIPRPNRSERGVLFNEDATLWLTHVSKHHHFITQSASQELTYSTAIDSKASNNDAGYHAFEDFLNEGQLHCAYDHWECDFVGRDEIFWKSCQRLRLAYFRRASIDLFRFSSREASYLSQGPEAVVKDTDISTSEVTFIEKHRHRVEVAYTHMKSTAATSSAPVKEVLFILYSLSDSDVARGMHDPPFLLSQLEHIRATLRHGEIAKTSSSVIKSNMFSILLGLALLLLGARQTVRRLSQIIGNVGIIALHNNLPETTARLRAGNRRLAWISASCLREGSETFRVAANWHEGNFLTRSLISRAKYLSKAN